jgi:hypothetical protein
MTPHTSRKLHALFSELASELNKKELRVSGANINTRWNAVLVKELIWRQALEYATDFSSTREMKDEQAELLYRAINERLKKRYGVDVPYESAEEMTHMEEYQ